MKLMNPDDIPAFIDEVIATSCRPIAVANGWIVGDADLPEPQCENVQPVLRAIRKKYGERDHLVEEIAAHLRSLGLVVWDAFDALGVASSFSECY